MKSLEQAFSDIENGATQEVRKLLAVARRAIEQRDECALDDHDHKSWDRCEEKYNAELLKLLEGK